MERDFLGIGGGRDLAMREEAGYLGRSAVWPFLSVAPSKQQFMNFQASQEERSKTLVFDQVPSSGFQPVTADAFTSAHRFPSVVSQKHLGTDGQGFHQFQLPGYPARGSEPFNGSAASANHPSEVITFPAVSQNSFPIGTTGPFFRPGCSATGTSVTFHGAGPLTASVAPRDMMKPPGGTAQLTIFYGGMVNVYDDIPLEKALAIMFLADNASSVNSSVGNVPVLAPVAAPTKVSVIETKNMSHAQNMNHNQTHLTPVCSALPSPISTASHSGAQSGSGSNSTADVTGAKTSISPTSQQESPKSIVTTAVGSSSPTAALVPRAVPQARKASLARFLEKRKERVTNVAPYPSPQKLPDCTSAVDGKSVTGEAPHSSNLEQSWCLSTHKKSSDSSNSLSTKLEM
ncbi:hypothetical protein Taro_029829 [Colocasia esculenta]|uniref:Protein TIFY n=1 Tax=Colocasia esculenta TaxID=4460 RepID=A0A843VQ67_COLES|nr:hypothetical protein [Colocasia esculenta]